ncbi:MAG TPA: NAD(P)/FAD-dependent oxidoreductase [Kofleriaceae bacterium]|nr:NAD(P)/FAD-dependent oxidoreductase [Kofleriaceae bacterium]
MNSRADVVIVGAGHNGLVASVILAGAGLDVAVVEEKDVVGGACRTEHPFASAPDLGVSTGAYLLGLMPPELFATLGIDLPVMRRDPHYFLPTTGDRYLLLGSDRDSTRRQYLEFFSEADWLADCALQQEIAALRDDIAPTWLAEPLSIEDTAERYVRPALRQVFVDLCKKPIGDYLARFDFHSDLIKAMYAVTDGFSGLCGTYNTPGTGMNFLIHNMCRLPGSGGTWMVVKGGMGTVTQTLADRARSLGARIHTGTGVAAIERQGGAITGVALADGSVIQAPTVLVNADPFRMRSLVGADALGPAFNQRLDGYRKDGTTMKVNLCLRELPVFRCLPEDRGQYGPTIHILPEDKDILATLERTFAEVMEKKLPDFPTMEMYIHTAIDPSLRDGDGRHNAALFVQWVPYELADSTWEAEEDRYVAHLLSIVDRFAPNTSASVQEVFALHPQKIEEHFGISRGHIHHVDNSFGFADRVPYALPVAGLYSCSAGCHPAGSVIGAAGHNAARRVLADLGLPQPS